MSNSASGIILQGIGGFYYVETADAVIECHARGSLRRQGITPLAGDRVTITVDDGKTGTLESVSQRKNYLVRPPVANIDVLVLVASVCEPKTNTFVLDKMIAIAEKKDICPIIVINKTDLASPDELLSVYTKTGLECFVVSAKDPASVEPLRQRLAGNISAFSGNSGVGKSSLLNAIDPTLSLETGVISQKLGRGKHTTRSASLYPFNGGYIVDTPGFTSLDLERAEPMEKDQLPFYFREFAPFLSKCRFTGCAHIHEPGCGVREAVENGTISQSRYESYVSLYESVKDKKEWE